MWQLHIGAIRPVPQGAARRRSGTRGLATLKVKRPAQNFRVFLGKTRHTLDSNRGSEPDEVRTPA
jgi:hypothetical protein